MLLIRDVFDHDDVEDIVADEGADDFGRGFGIRGIEDMVERIVRIDWARPWHKDAAATQHHRMSVTNIPLTDFQGAFED